MVPLNGRSQSTVHFTGIYLVYCYAVYRPKTSKECTVPLYQEHDNILRHPDKCTNAFSFNFLLGYDFVIRY